MPNIRAEFSARSLQATDASARAIGADADWSQLWAGIDFRALSVAQLELIFRRYGITLSARQVVADLQARKLAIGTVNLDTLIRFIREHFADDVATIDALQILTKKALEDSASVTDKAALSLQKALADVIIPVDGVSFSFGKELADTLSAPDAVSVTIHKTFDDYVTAHDAVLISGEELVGLADNAAATDTAVIAITKQISDAVSVSESFTLIVTFAPAPHSMLNGYPIGDFTLGD